MSFKPLKASKAIITTAQGNRGLSAGKTIIGVRTVAAAAPTFISGDNGTYRWQTLRAP